MGAHDHGQPECLRQYASFRNPHSCFGDVAILQILRDLLRVELLWCYKELLLRTSVGRVSANVNSSTPEREVGQWVAN